MVLQGALPDRLVLHPTWLLPTLEALLLVALVIANPYRINKRSKGLRLLGLSTAALLSLANAWSVTRLVIGLVNGTEGNGAGSLLITGGIIWLTNVIVFALWYWEFDRGGPASRANADRAYPDFQFAQMATPQLAPPDWEPASPTTCTWRSPTPPPSAPPTCCRCPAGPRWACRSRPPSRS